MDQQPTLPNSPSPAPAERPSGLTPEDLQAGAPGAEARAEMAPAPSAAPPAAAAPASKLSAADVAAVIAATPGGAVPPSAGPTQMPVTADDVDVIEPEWVDKAEQVVQAHQGDPYGEEEAIEDLQQDYLQKRYGFKVADPDGGKKEGT